MEITEKQVKQLVNRLIEAKHTPIYIEEGILGEIMKEPNRCAELGRQGALSLIIMQIKLSLLNDCEFNSEPYEI